MNEELLGILAAAGGGSVIVLGLSAFLGKVWSNRIVERERASFAFELERERQAATRALEHEKASFTREFELLRAELQATHDHSRRVADARFTLYAEVWDRLQRLREAGDNLWQDATRETAERFGLAFLEARSATNRGRLILRDNDFRELHRVFDSFAQYDIGKRKLIQMRSPEDVRDNAYGVRREIITSQIEQNRGAREQYERLLENIARQFRVTLGTDA